jgi:hypothetical protein
MTKEVVLAAVNALPAEISLEDLIERLIFIEKIEAGLRDSVADRTISHEEAKAMAKSWSK